MLYITTRDNKDAFTAHHALTENCAADGGGYVPFQLPRFDKNELSAMKEKPFGQIVADILNLFFSSRLTNWDVDCCIGRNVFKISSIHHKIAIAELWYNLNADYAYITDSLYKLLVQDNDAKASEWFCIATRIAVLFGVFAKMQADATISDSETFDICLPVNDFSSIMAAFYARSMGLPIEKIICTEIENSCLWDLTQRGVLNTWACDAAMRAGVERLLQAIFGFDSVRTFCERADKKLSFSIGEAQLAILRETFFCSVVGKSRIDNIISSLYRSNDYIVHPQTALCHGGLQDFRAKTGVSRLTLLLADKTPLKACEQISSATGVDKEALTDRIRLS